MLQNPRWRMPGCANPQACKSMAHLKHYAAEREMLLGGATYCEDNLHVHVPQHRYTTLQHHKVSKTHSPEGLRQVFLLLYVCPRFTHG